MKKNILRLFAFLPLLFAGINAWALSTRADGTYVIKNAADLYAFAQLVNGGNFGASAVVTADIDYTAYGTKGDGLIGGTDDGSAFTGSFDAQNHKITIATNLDRNTCGRGEGMGGLFGRVGEGSKISNLWLAGTLMGNGHRMSGLCQNAFGTTITNVLVNVDIISTWAGNDSDLASGGILGQAEKVNYLKNVVFAGSFKCKGNGGDGNNEWFGGMLGWVENGQTTMENCAAIIYSVEQDAASAFKSQNPGGKQKNSPMSRHDEQLVIAKNCFYQLPPQWTEEWEHYKDYFVDNNDPKDIWSETVLTKEQVLSGELCYKLNNYLGENLFTQDVDIDYFVIPYACHDQVYFTDGKYTNYNGVYYINSAEKLNLFAHRVNAGGYNLNAVVTADIDYTKYGTDGNGLIGGTSDETAFTGSFDAQGHKIKIATNLERGSSGRGEGMGGLFGRVGEGSKISNLWLDGTLTGNGHRMSGLCQNAFGTTITNVLVSVDIISTWAGNDSDLASGGILGQAEKVNYLKNVIYAGSFKCKDNGGDGNNEWFGGMLGWVENGQTTMENCAAIINSVEQDAASAFKSQNPGGKQKNSPMSRHDEQLVIAKNCFYQLPPQWTEEWEHYKDYFVDNNDPKDIWSETVVTKEQVASGELTYLMNGSQSESCIFFQSIGFDKYPLPFEGHDIVYKHGSDFTNADEDGVYTISTAEQLYAYAKAVNAGDYGRSAKLANDIDYTAYGTYGDALIGGTSDESAFTGSFDGQNHKVTIATNLERGASGRGEGMGGLFGRVGEGSKISNLWLEGTLTGNGHRMSGLCQNAFGTTITNVMVNVDIISTWAGNDSDLASGGILGQAEKVNYLKNVAFVGSFKCKDNGGDGNNEWFAGMLGWVENGQTTMENCIAIINSVEQDAASAFKSQNPGGKQKNSPMSRHDEQLVIAKNCYYQLPPQWTQEWEHYKDYFVDNNDPKDIWDETAITSEQAQSGEICFKLNGDQSEIGYWQTIGEDLFPTPIEEENGQVYLKDGRYTNSDVDIIRTAADLYAFAQAVKAGDYGRNAKVVADIDYTAYKQGVIGGDSDDRAYTGTFDAQNHKITVDMQLDRNNGFTGEGQGGLFGRLGEGSKISNLWLDGKLTGNGHRMSGLCQNAFGTTITNVLVSLDIVSTWAGFDSDLASGGILGQAEKVNYLTNVVFAGTFKCKDNGGDGNNEWFGGMLGWVENGQTTMENCAAIIYSVEQDAASAFKSQNPGGKQKNSPMSRHDEQLVIAKNCYYQLPPQWTEEWEHYKDYFVDNNDPKDIWDETPITSEQVQSGELTFRLNGNQGNVVFYQTIGTDKMPVISPNGHKQVFGKGSISCSGELKGNNSFSNNAPNEMDPHDFVDGKCTVCGALSSEAVLTMDPDGYYMISNQYLMQKAIDMVNAGDNAVNFRLYADIDFTDEAYKLSSFSTFSGIFDGQYHTLTLNMQKASASLFGTLNGTCRNLIVTGKMVNTGEYAGVITATPGNCTIENVVSDVEFHGHYTGTNGASCMGGFIGNGGERTVNLVNCIFTGKFVQDKVENSPYTADPDNDWYDFCQIGGLMGKASSGANNIRNCIVAGEAPEYHGPCHPQSGNRGGSTHEFEEGSSFVGVKRGNANVTNIYATVDYTGDLQWGKMLSPEQGASGELCYIMNGGAWDEPVWRQNIGEDEYPMPIPTRGIVYKLEADGTYMDVHDVPSMEAFQPLMQNDENAWFSDIVANEQELAGFEELVEAAATAKTVEEFKVAYKVMKEKRAAITENVTAYADYIAQAEEFKAYLEENALEGEDADKLKSYLNDDVDPNEVFPNGSYSYVVGNTTLTTQGIKDEKEFLSALFRKALGNGYQPGSDITILLTNGDFSNGWTGWGGNGGTGTASSLKPAVREAWNGTMDRYQKLTGLKNGIYELKLNGLFRPANNDHSTNYAAYLYAYGAEDQNWVPFMAISEDPIPVSEAVNQENSYIANVGTHPYDNEFQFVEDGELFYVPNSVDGASYAFKGNRYENRILVNVTDGTLNVGVYVPGTGASADWAPFGGTKLIYQGEFDSETATASFDRVLEGMIARAETLIAYEANATDPNAFAGFSQAEKDGLQACINDVSAATTNAEKNALVVRFSNLFKQIKNTKDAYKYMVQMANLYMEAIGNLSEASAISQDDLNKFMNAYDATIGGFESGAYTADEARALKAFEGLGLIPTQDADGFYQIGTIAEFAMFAELVRGVNNGLNAKQTADIEGINFGMGITDFSGTYDGGFHTLTMNIDTDQEWAAPFRGTKGNALIKNLITRGTINTSYMGAGGIVGSAGGNTRIENCESYVVINTTKEGDATEGGIIGRSVGGSVTVTNVLFAGSISGEKANCCAGISGWISSGTLVLNNVLMIGDINVGEEGSATFARNTGSCTLNNCYYKEGAMEIQDHTKGTKVTADQLKSGEIAYLLNGEKQGEGVAWYQNVGVDANPTIVPNKDYIVYMQENGTFSNEPTAIESIAAEKDANNVIYDLTGRRVEKARKGLYIINGKKVLVK